LQNSTSYDKNERIRQNSTFTYLYLNVIQVKLTINSSNIIEVPSLTKMNEMFETNHLQSVINTFQSLYGSTNSKDDQKLNECIHQILNFIDEFTYLKHAIDSSVIVAATDIAGNIIYANDKFCKLSKYSRQELIGQNHRILNSGYHDKPFFKQMWEQISKGEVWEGEIRNRAKDGSIYWVKTTIVPLNNEDGKPTMYMVLRTDITEGKLAQENLVNALENDFRLVINSMNNLIFKVARDENNDYKYILNEGKLFQYLGFNQVDMMQRSPREIFPKEFALILESKFDHVFAGNNVTLHNSFKEKHLLTSLSPVYQGDQVIEIIGCTNDITDLHDAQEKVKFMAFHDSITNLPNRRKFNEDLLEFTALAQQQNHKVAVCFLDLDRFKQINDSFGHTIGDNLIREIAKRLKEAVGTKGNVYRFAGDEFIIVYPSIDSRQEINPLAEQILLLFEGVFVLTNNLEIYASPSIGISIYPDHGEDYDTLLKNADTAMYSSKTSNQLAYTFYDPVMNSHFEEALLIEHHLRKAIDYDELELYYQPKLDLKTGEINGVEALLRWHSPFLGNVPPSKFIPIAEDTGLIIKLDEWVLEKACQQNKEWNSFEFTTPVKIAVNISPQHFRLPNFENVVKKVLDKTGLPPHLLEIEITEHSIIDNTEECITCLTKLNALGVTVAIDDFGIGYSSLNYLRKLPIHSLKIDRTFIQEVADNNEDIAIVKAITYLAHELNLRVVAEGIESQEVISILEKLGCDEIQGYYISRPLAKSDFEQNYRRVEKK
jgi:diguanylate cyclase (GGDEF)-like protein/PAS domain S-box-containing protein